MRYDLKNQFSSLHIVRYNFSFRGKALKFYVVKFQSFASNRKVVSDNMQARKLVFFFCIIQIGNDIKKISKS